MFGVSLNIQYSIHVNVFQVKPGIFMNDTSQK